ncbi:uncharacterized protein LOC135936206 [Cloeon dipterum]|uniref:uncharacterized protein LOC135936206 n=1 Tax=Cloeon dipterum TaxID=197152 RepID=UPI0032207459
MSHKFWPYWHSHKEMDRSRSTQDLVRCSSNNYFAPYVVGLLNKSSCYIHPGYVHRNLGTASFGTGYFVQENNQPVYELREYYFLVGGDVSFRPFMQVAENLRFKVGCTKQNRPIYIGTMAINGQELSGPVIDGTCFTNYNGAVYFDKYNYKILALNEG